MSNRERRKGRDGEAEVRRVFEAHGWTVRGLEGSGDWLAWKGGVGLHVECKRQETLRLPLWARQAAAETPAGMRPVVAFRRNREPWQAATPSVGLPHHDRFTYLVRDLNGAWWAVLPLAKLAGILAA